MQIVPRACTLAQARVALHVPLATVPEPQHGWPEAPQAVHIAAAPPLPAAQANPVEQLPPPPPQQRCPAPPQATHDDPASPAPVAQVPPV
jgi:hypothetical protein